jgi:phage terminase large subunit-like protein
MKQETLEEAAEKRIPTSSKVWDLTETRRNDFIAGALWQQEQDKKLYSEEEVRDAYHCGRLYLGFDEFMKQFNNK